MFCLYPLQVLDNFDLVVLDFKIISELAIFTGVWLSVSNRKEFLYVHIFIGIFIVFVVFASKQT